VAPRKRKHRRGSEFIDDTAAVASDEEEEEEDEEEGSHKFYSSNFSLRFQKELVGYFFGR
jgi:hypothetical protein